MYSRVVSDKTADFEQNYDDDDDDDNNNNNNNNNNVYDDNTITMFSKVVQLLTPP